MTLIDLVADKGTKAKTDPALNVGPRLQAATRRRGIIVRCNNDGIAIAPPLNVAANEIDEIVGASVEAIREVMG